MKRLLIVSLVLFLLTQPLASLAWGPELFYITREELPGEVNAFLDSRLLPGEIMFNAHKSAPYIFLLSKTAEDERRLFIFEEKEQGYICVFESGALPAFRGIKPGIISGHHSVSLQYGESPIFTFNRFGEEWLLSLVQGEDTFSIGPYALKAHMLGKVFTDELPPDYGAYSLRRSLMSVTEADLPATYAQAQHALLREGVAVVNNPNPKDRLHLRAKPDRNADALGKFYNGTPALVLEEQGAWTRVRIGELDGWMMSRYLAEENELGSVRPAFPPDLSLREGFEDKPRSSQPGITSPAISQVDWGYELGDIIGVIGEEWYILMNGAGQVCFMRQAWFWKGNG